MKFTVKEKIMPRLYFKYGTMGSSKSAQALMCKFNYEQKGMKVMLVKPSIDNRGDSEEQVRVRSRIGLSADCEVIKADESFIKLFERVNNVRGCDCIIVDEAQFCTERQVDELKQLTKFVPVLCYGLLNDFRCKLFEGSKRLVELADSLQEIKSVCRCGRKSTVVFIGGDESYENMCYWCWKEELEKANSN